jgi:hypothetical protein
VSIDRFVRGNTGRSVFDKDEAAFGFFLRFFRIAVRAHYRREGVRQDFNPILFDCRGHRSGACFASMSGQARDS